jgi:ligand-binding sensor domain-containing protein
MRCALPGARLISLAIDGQGSLFAGTTDGRVLGCPRE